MPEEAMLIDAPCRICFCLVCKNYQGLLSQDKRCELL